MTRSRTPVAAFFAAAALLVAGCSGDPAPPSDAAAPPAAAPDAPAAAPAARAAPARAVQESSGVEAAPAEGAAADASLERLTLLAAQDQLPTGRWQAGRHYKPLVPAQPTNVAGGKVEVLEVFWYGCGHCAALDPFLENWKKKTKPANVEFVRVPVTWSPGHIMHGRLFYTLEALGRADLHPKVFDTIHRGGNMLLGNDEDSTFRAQLAWAKANGVAEKAFSDAWQGMAVTVKLQQAADLVRRYRVDGVPLMVVNGKYTTDVSDAGGHEQLLALINDLAAAEKRR
jgi:thiol:disulfide interchange protein DsbA